MYLTPLIYSRNEKVGRKAYFNLRAYVAFALGCFGDQRAVESLESTLKKDGFIECIYALARLKDASAVSSIISVASNKDLFTLDVHQCLKYITRTEFEVKRENNNYKIVQFPEAGEGKYSDIYKILWQYWLKNGDKYAKEQFDKYYPEWKTALKNKPDAKSRHEGLQERMLKGGISALPYIIDKIETGDEELIKSVKKITNGSGNSLDKDAGWEDCLNWWKENKDKWSMVQK